MNVLACVEIILLAKYLAIVVVGLPDFKRRREIVREASTDVLHGLGEVVGCDEEMDMVGHDDEGM